MTVTTHRVELAPFFCPVAPALHPAVDQVEARSLAWMEAMDLCRDEQQRRRARATRSAHFYAGMTPDADQDRLELATQWVYWGFAFDDAWCDGEPARAAPDRFVRQAGRALRAMETGDARLCGGDPYLLAARDLAERYRARATPVQTRRWVDANRLWLFGVAQQHAHRARGAPPTVDDYLAVRLHDCGGAPTQSMYEFVCGAEVPGHEMDAPPVRAVTEAMWMVAALDNDRVSRYKELLAEQDDHDLVSLLGREHGVGAEQAADEAVALRDRIMCCFLRLRDALAPRASTPLRTYLAALAQGIRSNIDWSLEVPRYATATGTTRLVLQANVVDEPSDRSPGPPPYPSIAWWWDQLAAVERGRTPGAVGG